MLCLNVMRKVDIKRFILGNEGQKFFNVQFEWLLVTALWVLYFPMGIFVKPTCQSNNSVVNKIL